MQKIASAGGSIVLSLSQDNMIQSVGLPPGMVDTHIRLSNALVIIVVERKYRDVFSRDGKTYEHVSYPEVTTKRGVMTPLIKDYLNEHYPGWKRVDLQKHL
jgi:hypothetical protein